MGQDCSPAGGRLSTGRLGHEQTSAQLESTSSAFNGAQDTVSALLRATGRFDGSSCEDGGLWLQANRPLVDQTAATTATQRAPPGGRGPLLRAPESRETERPRGLGTTRSL